MTRIFFATLGRNNKNTNSPLVVGTSGKRGKKFGATFSAGKAVFRGNFNFKSRGALVATRSLLSRVLTTFTDVLFRCISGVSRGSESKIERVSVLFAPSRGIRMTSCFQLRTLFTPLLTRPFVRETHFGEIAVPLLRETEPRKTLPFSPQFSAVISHLPPLRERKERKNNGRGHETMSVSH